jgi:hypothetical protein
MRLRKEVFQLQADTAEHIGGFTPTKAMHQGGALFTFAQAEAVTVFAVMPGTFRPVAMAVRPGIGDTFKDAPQSTIHGSTAFP